MGSRVSFQTSFFQNNLNRNPKLVIIRNKHLFWLFHFYTETESFDISIEPKQIEDQLKQFDREHILVFFRKFWVVLICFSLFRNSSVCFDCFDIGSKHQNKRNKLNFFAFGFTKQTKAQLKEILFRFEPNFLFVCSRTPWW